MPHQPSVNDFPAFIGGAPAPLSDLRKLTYLPQ